MWRDLVAAAVPRGLVPPVLTNNLGVSIAGTLSVAGLGVASYRYGTQADNALELEVVTGEGEVVTCSAEENRDLFDVVRCGFGQFGIITARQGCACAAAGPRCACTTCSTTTSAPSCRTPRRSWTRPTRASTPWSRAARPARMFIRRIGEGMGLGTGVQLFAYWMYPMFLTVEYDEGEAPDDRALLSGLHYYRHLHTEEWTQLEFCNRLDPIFELWQRSGNWEMAHPWMEVILPWEQAREFIEFVQGSLPPQALGPAGHVLVWPAHVGASHAPLFMYPPGEFVMGWGILPAVPQKFLAQALAQLDMASELAIGYGGKRYLSGYITFDTPEKWAAHFGDQWEMVKAAKKRFDPDGILAPGFIQYE